MKASILHFATQQDFNFDKTSPNKSQVFEYSNCDKTENEQIVKSLKTLSKFTHPDFPTVNNFVKHTHSKENTKFFSETQKLAKPRLFLLYSQLKIAMF